MRHTSTCSQIPPDGTKTDGKDSALKWAQVGAVLKEVVEMKQNGSLQC